MRLSDCFIEPIAYVAYEVNGLNSRQPAYDRVRNDILKLMKIGEKRLDANHYSFRDYEDSRFAVCAWIDEAIMQSDWEHKMKWQEELLQRIFYKTTGAGVEFFERLNKLESDQLHIREVYYLCLTLGFTGRFCFEDADVLIDQVKSANCKILTGESTGIFSITNDTLFPGAYQGKTDNLDPYKNYKKSFSFLFLILCFIPPGLFAFLFYIYRFVLENENMKI